MTDPAFIAQPESKSPAVAAAEEARSFAQFITWVEDGKLNQDLSEGLRELNAKLNDHFRDHGGKPKATLTLKIDFTLDKGVFDIENEFKITLPKVPRGRTVAWSTPGSNFTPDHPKQMSFLPREPRPV